jgi:hypothetical protein
VWRVVWGEADRTPQLVRQWLTNERATEPMVFDAEVRTVCGQYARAQELHAAGVHLVSTDEKTGIQALEWLHPTRALRPGLVARQEHEDQRHGTQCLIANVEIATGDVIVPTIGPTRTAADFAAHSARTVATDPNAGWVLIVDQLNTHQSEEVVKVVAQQGGIALDLDKQGHIRNMKAMASRAAVLADACHRIRCGSTPKHTSWLNQVELWFSILVRTLLKRGSFTSVDDLRDRLLRFIEYVNQTMAQPFKWTYKGRPLQV